MINILQMLSQIDAGEKERTDAIYNRQDKFRQNAVEDFKISQAVDSQNFDRWDRQQDNTRADKFFGLQEQQVGMQQDRHDFQQAHQEEEWQGKVDAASAERAAAKIKLENMKNAQYNAFRDQGIKAEALRSLSGSLDALDGKIKAAPRFLMSPVRNPEGDRNMMSEILGDIAQVKSSMEGIEKDDPNYSVLQQRLGRMETFFSTVPAVKDYVKKDTETKLAVKQLNHLQTLKELYPGVSIIENAANRVKTYGRPLDPGLMETIEKAGVTAVTNQWKTDTMNRQAEIQDAVARKVPVPPPRGVGAAVPGAGVGVPSSVSGKPLLFLNDAPAAAPPPNGRPQSFYNNDVDLPSGAGGTDEPDSLLMPFEP